MAAGLFYVYTEPGSVDEAEFHDWYDHEHGPARLTVPGFGPAYRYQALDGEKPPWLALYELDRPDVIDSPEYKALSANASDRDKVRRRRAGHPGPPGLRADQRGRVAGGPPAPVILAVAMSVPEASEDDLAAWYAEEHVPMLLKVPGWRRIRRFRLTRALDGPGPEEPEDPGGPGEPEPGSFLSVHELAGPEVLEDPGYRAAVSTPWRDRVVASALRRERRVFGLRNAIGA